MFANMEMNHNAVIANSGESFNFFSAGNKECLAKDTFSLLPILANSDCCNIFRFLINQLV